MLKHLNISMTGDLRQIVHKEVAERSYSNASEYIRDLIRRDIQIQDERRSLAKAIDAGLQSKSTGNSLEEDMADLRNQLQQKYGG